MISLSSLQRKIFSRTPQLLFLHSRPFTPVHKIIDKSVYNKSTWNHYCSRAFFPPSLKVFTCSKSPHGNWCSRAICSSNNLRSQTEEVYMESISYLNQEEAQAVDVELMGRLGFSVDQLMELAGLSVACSIFEVYQPPKYNRILVVCGPGNNGGDGLVAARHLYHFGYKPVVCYPKRTDKALYNGLVVQLESLGIKFVDAEKLPEALGTEYDVILDAIFGFSFKGVPRAPFDQILSKMTPGEALTKSIVPPVISVDIPSGWHVENGDVEGKGLKPEMLVSLTAPKSCSKKFGGPHHFLGGRFVPPAIAQKYNLRLPAYRGAAMCVRIGRGRGGLEEEGAEGEKKGTISLDVSAMRESYNRMELREEDVEADPIEQFRKWFSEAMEDGSTPEPNAMCLSTVGGNGKPSSRMVLLKGFDERGFVWFTNYNSRKGQELLSSHSVSNPNPASAALVFWWPGMQRQVRIEGKVEQVDEKESDEYFKSRPRMSQIGAHVSPQSQEISSRDKLDSLEEKVRTLFPEGAEIPRPKEWGGFRLFHESIEFWQGRPSRLHDRLVYKMRHGNGSEEKWEVIRLAP